MLSLLLSLLIALCWLIIIHTLKWLAIRSLNASSDMLTASATSNWSQLQTKVAGGGGGDTFQFAPHLSSAIAIADPSTSADQSAGLDGDETAKPMVANLRLQQAALAAVNQRQHEQAWRRKPPPMPPEAADTNNQSANDSFSVNSSLRDSIDDATHAEATGTRQLRSPSRPVLSSDLRRRMMAGHRRPPNQLPPIQDEDLVAVPSSGDASLSSASLSSFEIGKLDDETAQKQAASGVAGKPRPGNSVQAPAPPPLLFKAPFFTSWSMSVWNIFFAPVFTLISSCCFRSEDSATKKLLV